MAASPPAAESAAVPRPLSPPEAIQAVEALAEADLVAAPDKGQLPNGEQKEQPAPPDESSEAQDDAVESRYSLEDDAVVAPVSEEDASEQPEQVKEAVVEEQGTTEEPEEDAEEEDESAEAEDTFEIQDLQEEPEAEEDEEEMSPFARIQELLPLLSQQELAQLSGLIPLTAMRCFIAVGSRFVGEKPC